MNLYSGQNRPFFLMTVLFFAFCSTVHAQDIFTVAGTGTPGYTGDGFAATTAKLHFPTQTAMDNAGNVYFTDYTNSAVRKISNTGIITTIAGTGTAGYSGDVFPASSAKLNQPTGIAVDGSGNVYISDWLNFVVRKIDASGIISTIAGTGVYGYTFDGIAATAAEITKPWGIVADAAGNVYFSDRYNSRIRKINPAGIISTIAGTGVPGWTGDGAAATAARINDPVGLYLDPSGNFYFCDFSTHIVRKIDASGIISTIGGTGTSGYSGDGSAATNAKMSFPCGIGGDNFGNIYVAENGNSVVRKINTSGTISTIAGTGVAGYTTDGIAATSSKINGPQGLGVYGPGNIYISDVVNNRIRIIYNHVPTFTGGKVQTLNVCVSTSSTVNSLLAVSDQDTSQPLTWKLITAPTHGVATVSYSSVSTGGIITPTGLSYTPTAGYTGTDVFQVAVNDSMTWDTTTIDVTVFPVPVAGPITGVDTPVCPGMTLTLSDTTAGGIWTASNTSASVTGGIVTAMSGGIDVISYLVTNVCGTVAATATVTVNPAPSAGSIIGLSSVCTGSTLSLSDAVTGGIWNSSNTSASVSGGTVTGLTAGLDTISYFYTNSCGTSSTAVSVNVLALPVAGVITGPSTLCVGANITLTDVTGGGMWTSSNANASVIAGVVTGMATGVSTISYSVSNSCGTASATHGVSMSGAVPVVGAITGPLTEFCAGSSVTLSESSTGGVWISSNGNARVSGGMVTGLSGGVDTIYYSITNGCGSAIAGYTVTVDPLPAIGSILGLTDACVGFTITLADGVSGGSWSSSDNTIATVTGTGIVRGISPGTAFIIYTTTNGCGNSVVRYPFTVRPQSDCISRVGVPTVQAQQNNIVVYPNPNAGTFTLNISSENTEQDNIVITNMLGEKIVELTTASNTEQELHLNVSSGLYFLTATNGRERFVTKVNIVNR